MKRLTPNGVRLSCGAELERSQTRLPQETWRRQLQALVRRHDHDLVAENAAAKGATRVREERGCLFRRGPTKCR